MTDIDEVFDGDLVEGIPPVDWEYQRKAPGDADGDNQGDHCAG